MFIKSEINHNLNKHYCDTIRALHEMKLRIFSTAAEIGIKCLELEFFRWQT